VIGLAFFSEILSEELKQDLEVTSDGLNSYLNGMKENADKQNEQIATLVQERAEMIQRMKEMEPLSEIAHSQQAEIATLQQVCSVANVS